MRRLLVADDEPGIRTLVEFLLEPEGWTVEAVPDGATAITRLSSGEFDLALLDVHMPRCNGVQALQMVHSQRPELPIVVMTSGSDPIAANVEWLREQGATGLLLKPFELDELLSIVRTASGGPGE